MRATRRPRRSPQLPTRTFRRAPRRRRRWPTWSGSGRSARFSTHRCSCDLSVDGMDRVRLDSSFREVSAAQAAYDKALRAVAGATTAAGSAQLQSANAELAAARQRVAAARVTLDASRLAELATFQTGNQLLGTVEGNQVLALFPVGVEAKLGPGRLRVRVWPDAMTTSTHDPRLTPPELDA